MAFRRVGVRAKANLADLTFGRQLAAAEPVDTKGRAGSGHIAGVVNPPAAQKSQYWVNDEDAPTLEAFIAKATEHKGSWWPDWLAWLKKQDEATVKVQGARVPGGGKLKAIEDAPGSYVKAR